MQLKIQQLYISLAVGLKFGIMLLKTFSDIMRHVIDTKKSFIIMQIKQNIIPWYIDFYISKENFIRLKANAFEIEKKLKQLYNKSFKFLTYK